MPHTAQDSGLIRYETGIASEIESMRMGYAQTIEQTLDSVNLRKGESVLVVP